MICNWSTTKCKQHSQLERTASDSQVFFSVVWCPLSTCWTAYSSCQSATKLSLGMLLHMNLMPPLGCLVAYINVAPSQLTVTGSNYFIVLCRCFSTLMRFKRYCFWAERKQSTDIPHDTSPTSWKEVCCQHIGHHAQLGWMQPNYLSLCWFTSARCSHVAADENRQFSPSSF